MLCRLRQPSRNRRVWVDAICINQSDVDERHAQVAIMGQIYRRASHVIVDIGEGSEDSDEALTLIQSLSPTHLYPMVEGLNIQEKVNTLYRRPWFSRIWVLQEVFMAQKASVLCGRRYVPWDAFRPLRICVSSREAGETEDWDVRLPNPQPNPMTIGKRSERIYTAKKDLLPLLCKGRTSEATDPGDKVFALFPLLEDAAQAGLGANYMKAYETVFSDVAAWLVENVGLEFLPCVRGDPVFCVPSWVPDWSLPIREPWMLSLSGLFHPLFASRDSHPKTSIPSPGELRVRGIYVDMIRTTTGSLDIRTTPFWNGLEMNKDHAAVTAFLAEFESHRKSLGDAAVKLPEPMDWHLTTSAEQLHPPDWLMKCGMPFEKPLSDNDTTNYVTYLCHSRQLVTTEKGYIGLASNKARTGDMICVFLGCKTPFVLREVLEGGNCDWENEGEMERNYRFLEEAYVWGLMEGEALAGLDLGKAEKVEAEDPFEYFLLC